MEQEITEKQFAGSDEIDLLQLLKLLLKKLWAIILVAAIVGAGFWGFTKYFITPTYQTSFTAYVNNKSDRLEQNSSTLTSSDIYASQSLVYTYSKIISSRSVLMAAIDELGVNYSYKELQNMVTTSVQDETEIITVQIVAESPAEAQKIAQAIADVSPDIVARIVEGSSMQIVDEPVLPKSMYAPNYVKNTLLGELIGAVLMAIVIVLKGIFSDNIEDEESLEEKFGIPVVGMIPDMDFASKKNYYYYEDDTEKNGEKNNG